MYIDANSWGGRGINKLQVFLTRIKLTDSFGPIDGRSGEGQFKMRRLIIPASGSLKQGILLQILLVYHSNRIPKQVSPWRDLIG